MQYLAYFADIIIFYQGDMMKKIKKNLMKGLNIMKSMLKSLQNFGMIKT